MNTFRRIPLIALTGLVLSACAGNSTTEIVDPNETVSALGNECIPIGYEGNRELARYLGLEIDDSEAANYPTEFYPVLDNDNINYEDIGEFFDEKAVAFGGIGVDKKVSAGISYFKAAAHFGVLLGNYLLIEDPAKLEDLQSLFVELAGREMTAEEVDSFQNIGSSLAADSQRVAQFTSIVSSADVQCL